MNESRASVSLVRNANSLDTSRGPETLCVDQPSEFELGFWTLSDLCCTTPKVGGCYRALLSLLRKQWIRLWSLSKIYLFEGSSLIQRSLTKQYQFSFLRKYENDTLKSQCCVTSISILLLCCVAFPGSQLLLDIFIKASKVLQAASFGFLNFLN